MLRCDDAPTIDVSTHNNGYNGCSSSRQKIEEIVPVTGAPYATLNTVLAGILFDK